MGIKYFIFQTRLQDESRFFGRVILKGSLDQARHHGRASTVVDEHRDGLQRRLLGQPRRPDPGDAGDGRTIRRQVRHLRLATEHRVPDVGSVEVPQ